MQPGAPRVALLVVPLACTAASRDGATGVVEATSVDGRELSRPPLDRDVRSQREAALEQARDAARRARVAAR